MMLQYWEDVSIRLVTALTGRRGSAHHTSEHQALSHPHDDRLRVNLCLVYSAAFVSSNTADSLPLSHLHAEIKPPYKSTMIKDFWNSGLCTHKVEQSNGCGRSLPLFFLLPVCMKSFLSTAAAYLFSLQCQERNRKRNALCRQSHASWEQWTHLERHRSVSYYLQLIEMLQDNDEDHCLIQTQSATWELEEKHDLCICMHVEKVCELHNECS